MQINGLKFLQVNYYFILKKNKNIIGLNYFLNIKIIINFILINEIIFYKKKNLFIYFGLLTLLIYYKIYNFRNYLIKFKYYNIIKIYKDNKKDFININYFCWMLTIYFFYLCLFRIFLSYILI